MKRSIAYWKWLLADVSLDRSTDVLPLLGFPTAHHAAFRRHLDVAGDIIGLSDSDAQALADFVISHSRMIHPNPPSGTGLRASQTSWPLIPLLYRQAQTHRHGWR